MAAQHQEVTVLWNGGWDTYVVDPGQVRDLPEEAFRDDRYSPIWYDGPNSGYPCWIKCIFLRRHNFGGENQGVRVIRHVDGGD